MPETTVHSTWLEIDLDALRSNVRHLKSLSGAQVMAVVKANGYGHGLWEVSRAAVEAGAAACGVARIEEALELRRHGLQGPILVLGETPAERLREARQADISVTIFSPDQVGALDQLSDGEGQLQVHVKVDTGMHRLGAQPDQVAGMLHQLAQIESVEIEGLFTHFASADMPADAANQLQLDRFGALLGELERSGLRPPTVHAANSAAMLTRPESRFDMVRPGIAIYGMHPSSAVQLPEPLQPVLQWKARLSQLRKLAPGEGVSYGHAYVTQSEESIGIVPVGYGDGYRRRNSNHVLVHGQRVPVRGRVCMDQILVDLTDVPQAAIGDEIVLLGTQSERAISAEDISDCWDCLNYEVTCGLSARLPRLYTGRSHS